MSTTTTEQELPKQYHHAGPEQRWYRFWEERKYFHSEPDPKRKPYAIVIPPPNVTGALHLGHALNNTIQDILIRSKRMRGFNALYMPGTDHAGIATQAVVERRLLEEEKLSRHDLGREKLVARIWDWKNEYERRILGQLKRLGCSCDWQRTRFTLDEVCARAVRHTFFTFFQEGLIYRGRRMVNWDTFLQTAVSDDEVFHEAVAGHFWHLRYPVIDPQPGEPTHVTVATTRPETMLGDTAVAVHPDPARALDAAEAELRQKLAEAAEKQRPEIQTQLDALADRRRTMLAGLEKLRDMARAGRKVMLPLMNREIPLVADEWAKPELGSGCVKITPAHDPNDYEVGKRQSLPMINVLNIDGTLNENAGPYAKLKILKARERVVADMEAAGLLAEVEDREIELAHSDRSKTPIEPLLADQWFVRMQDLAQSAMDAVSDGRVKIVPERYKSGYLDWLGEKRDWPISRQLWWGHQIPIWYAPGASEADLKRAFAGRDDVVWHRDPEHDRWLICAREEDLAEDAVPGCKLTREADVLDTWFSSALWPHSTFGWPEKTPELAYYYPTSALVTSRDIITLWVARMVLTGLHNVGDVPFREVFIHPKILDGYGETMSKSKGNGVDPVDIMEKFGADALRFGLAYLTTETQDVRMPVEFECPHCGALVEQTKKNRVLPRVPCKQCGKEFATQWAEKAADVALPRGAVVSDRFELARNFCNKLWNAARFVLMNLEGYTPGKVDDTQLVTEDRWILSRLATVTDGVTAALDAYHFADATRLLYEFAWDEFCSFYLEMVKARLQDPASRPTAQRVLAHTLDNLLRLLHPVIPFITEEIWQLLNEAAPLRGLTKQEPPAESVMIATWPEVDRARQDAASEARFARFQEVLGGLREIRSRQNLPPRTEIRFSLRCEPDVAALLEPMAGYFESMAKAQGTEWGPAVTAPATSANTVLRAGELFVDLAGLIDVEAEIARNQKERERLLGAIATKEKKLANANFVERAPAEVVEAERRSLTEQHERLAATDAALAALIAQRGK
ncbi:MAG TPA: class I tRNA ligase family protein [Pirellulales bacterium]|nr:class I tRNA ligase family protein [Pirellulales bacterium]